jgi:hypothetical protein
LKRGMGVINLQKLPASLSPKVLFFNNVPLFLSRMSVFQERPLDS